jgi:hypothetical protein
VYFKIGSICVSGWRRRVTVYDRSLLPAKSDWVNQNSWLRSSRLPARWEDGGQKAQQPGIHIEPQKQIGNVMINCLSSGVSGFFGGPAAGVGNILVGFDHICANPSINPWPQALGPWAVFRTRKLQFMMTSLCNSREYVRSIVILSHFFRLNESE